MRWEKSGVNTMNKGGKFDFCLSQSESALVGRYKVLSISIECFFLKFKME